MSKDIEVVSEAHPDYDKLASSGVKSAVEAARKSAGVVEVDPDWERKATPAQREARRRESLRRESQYDGVSSNPESIRAKFKIEIMFQKERTSLGPNLCGIQLWESGKKFHGGGDELMYWCMDTESKQGCKNAIPADCIKGPFAYCPSCNQGIAMHRATNMRVMRVPTKVLVDELVRLFHMLGSNADIYVKYDKMDVHYLAMEKAKGTKSAARLRGLHIYPLKNILKDTSSGADLAGRFFTFLTS